MLLNVASGATALPTVQALSATRNLALVDNNTFNVNSTATAYTVTIPPQSTVAWAADTEVHFLRSGTGAVTIAAGAGVTLNGTVASSVTLNVQHGTVTLKRVGADSWWLGGMTDAVQPLDATLTALAGVTTAADQLIYATGADTFNTATLTAQARALLDDVDQAAQRGTLGLGSAATRTALGTTGSLYSRDSILGTVSQSSGVPTGAIIERGSNANGGYVRYADGTQICTAAWTMDSATSFGTGTATDPYRTSIKTINWAATFSAAPAASAIPIRTGTGLARIGYVSGESVSTTQLVNLQVTAVTNDVAPTVYIQAIGRWF
jgi:hypothetical protein